MNKINELTWFSYDFLKKLRSLRFCEQIFQPRRDISLRSIRKIISIDDRMEFFQFREYSFGDDFRNIDWKLLARFDKLYVKSFVTSTVKKLDIIMDNSLSMNIGNPAKFSVEKGIALYLIYTAINSSLETRLFTMSNNLSYLCTLKKAAGFHNVLSKIKELKAFAHTNIALSLSNYQRHFLDHQRTLIIISDFLDENNFQDEIKQISNITKKTILVPVVAEQDLFQPYTGLNNLVDIEREKKEKKFLSFKELKKYKEFMERYFNALNLFCKTYNIIYISPFINTGRVETLFFCEFVNKKLLTYRTI